MRLGQDLRRRRGLQGVLVAPSRLQLSLNFVGRFRGPPTRAVMEKASSLADLVDARAFRVTLNRMESWRGEPQPLVLLDDDGFADVQELHADIHKALVRGAMAPRREPEFWPHVSLLRDQATVAPESFEPITWMVREFVLLDSIGGEGRPEVLGRWSLRD